MRSCCAAHCIFASKQMLGIRQERLTARKHWGLHTTQKHNHNTAAAPRLAAAAVGEGCPQELLEYAIEDSRVKKGELEEVCCNMGKPLGICNWRLQGAASQNRTCHAATWYGCTLWFLLSLGIVAEYWPSGGSAPPLALPAGAFLPNLSRQRNHNCTPLDFSTVDMQCVHLMHIHVAALGLFVAW